jgi:hypothetical protein
MSLTTRTYEKTVGFSSMTDDELFYVNGGSSNSSALTAAAYGGVAFVGEVVKTAAEIYGATKVGQYAGIVVLAATAIATAYGIAACVSSC